MWYIVIFPHENTVSIIPSSWYVEKSEECFWPPSSMKRLDIDKYIKEKYLPEENWKPYKAKIMGKYGDYKAARSKLTKAKEYDKLSSTDNEETGRGKRKKIKRHTNSSSASEADASASDDDLSYPSFLNLHSEKQAGCSSLKNHQVVQRKSNTTIDLPQSFTSSTLPHVSGNERKRKMFSRTKSRSLSPEILTKRRSLLEQSTDEFNLGGSEEQLHARTQSFLHLEDLSMNRSTTLSPIQATVSRNQTKEQFNSDTTASNILAILQKMQADESEFRVQVMRKLNLLNMKLNDVDANMLGISTNKENIQPDENVDQFHDLFPLSCEKLNNLEEKLEDVHYKQMLIKHLSYLGGANALEVVKRLMYKLFTNETGQCFSWDGAKGKRQFKNLKIADVIFNTVRANRNSKDSTDADIIVHIKKWLVRSKDRININQKNRQIHSESNEDMGLQQKSNNHLDI